MISKEPAKIHEETLILHFPMHVREGLRYLGGIPGLLRPFPFDHPVSVYSRKFIRYHLVYADFIWKAASRVIDVLGGPNAFVAAHVRRNDLQYKNVFIGAEGSIENMQELLQPKETMYLATDETAPGFFEPFKKRGFKVFTLQDIKKSNKHLWEDLGDIKPKYEGMIEQAVCSAARLFFGTPSSTFSSYTFRLRGYIHGLGPQSSCLYHTKKYTKEKFENTEPGSCTTSFKDDVLMWKP